MADLVIKGGHVLVGDTLLETDVVVTDGRIEALHDDAPLNGSAEVIDARGKYVLPGAIDPHTHIHWPYLDITTQDTFFTATRAAALGGITMIVDWAVQKREDPDAGPEGSLLAAFRRRRAEIDGQSVVDYALHSTLTVPDETTLASIPGVLEQGVSLLKLYMTYRKRGIMTDDGLLWDVLNEAAHLDTVVGIHAENAAIHEHKERQFRARGQTTPVEWGRHKAPIVESEAVHRAIYLAEKTGAPILLRHISTADALEFIRQARQRGAPIFAETCPQYLVLDESAFERPDGYCFICSPPIRGAADREAVWRALADGTIAILGSDHIAFSVADKASGGENALATPSGLPGIETLFPIVFSEGFMKGRISLPRLMALMATNTAKLYGWYPLKGVLLPGSDADIVVVDPEARRTLRAADLHMDTDYIPYEGLEVQGYPLHTISCGRVLVKDGEFQGEPGSGRFVPGRVGRWRALDPRWETR
ncbi:MAG: dihydropyrimidinase [Ardenticatenaceae bacterium]|nr:dihydropyrimidinase [Ardenticatenaceae bacterium]